MKVQNPFDIKTPEQNTAQDVVDLFVDVFADFHQVLEKGHTFLNGPRGSGKSMMFRYIMPDCQVLAQKKPISELEYFAIYIPIKLTNINTPDLGRLEQNAEIIINEHLLSTYVISKALASVINIFGDDLNTHEAEINSFFTKVFNPIIDYSGYKIKNEAESKNGRDIVQYMADIVTKMHNECFQYCRRIALTAEIREQYNGSITDFIDFVSPIIVGIKQLPFFPPNKPIYLLIDDAGYLSLSQTKILNTWVSYRTTKDICFKISTQLDYRTHITSNGKRIDSPHDYSEINISTVYSSSKSIYNERISEIVKKRLEKYLGLKVTDAREFFPEDKEQKQQIEVIYNKIRDERHDPDKNYAGTDAAKRYAVPEYMKYQQQHRAGYHFNYAGFDQLVAISSGIIRHFLAPAQEMFSTLQAESKDGKYDFIPDSIQDRVIKRYSTAFLTDEFEKYRNDCDVSTQSKADKLFNLIESLGELFHKILVSDLSERRVFSAALTDRPDDELSEILKMGEQYGYLHKSTIGNKQGTGRNRLYVLSRILAPHFKLDPSSFAGYQFLDSNKLKLALTNKKAFINSFKNKFGQEEDQIPQIPSLFDGIDD